MNKPVRYCVYCHKVIIGGNLKRHVFTRHKYEMDVMVAMSKPHQLQVKFINKIQRDGICWYNANIAKRSSTPADICSDTLLSERRTKQPGSVRFCPDCRKFIAVRRFRIHRKTCSGVSPVLTSQRTMSRQPCNDTGFISSILETFKDTDSGCLCKSDKVIQRIGHRYYCLRRRQKTDRKEGIKQEMLLLARLLIQFRLTASQLGVDAARLGTEDMFDGKHLGVLREATDALAEEGKSGVRLTFNVITRTVKCLKRIYAEARDDLKCQQLDAFLRAYQSRSHDMYVMARFHVGAQCFGERSTSMTQEEAMSALTAFVVKNIGRVTAHGVCRRDDYILLRSLVVCRLMLFNGRRGEAAVTMTVTEWRDAKDGEWLRKNKRDRYLVGQGKVAILHDKGCCCVPVLIPIDCVQPINTLISQRNEMGIVENNEFVFPNKASSSHCSGWIAVRHVCHLAGACGTTSTDHSPVTCHTTQPGITESATSTSAFEVHKDTDIAAASIVNRCDTTGSPPQGKKDTAETTLRPKKKANCIHWKKHDNELVESYFSSFFNGPGSSSGTKGKLPSKSAIMAFMRTSMPSCLQHLNEYTAYLKIRAQLFNRRKSKHQKLLSKCMEWHVSPFCGSV